MAELIGSGINFSPAKTWEEFEQQEVKELPKRVKRASRGTTLALVGLMALWGLTSSCCDKTVEEQVNDIVKDKQEQVDKLNKKEAKLEQELDKVRADKKFAEKELRDAKSRQK